MTARAQAKRQRDVQDMAAHRAAAQAAQRASHVEQQTAPSATGSASASATASGQSGVDSKPSASNVFAAKSAPTPSPSAVTDDQADGEALQGEDEEREELFEAYRPWYWKLGADHPDPVVETTSLAFVRPPRLDNGGSGMLPGILSSVLAHSSLSALQLESVAYAGIRHEQTLQDGTTAGFFIGDGPGVGKGRQLAAMVIENWIAGRKRHIWLSVSPDLEHDARRDINDLLKHMDASVGPIPVINLTSLSYRDIARTSGVLFCTYSALVSKEGVTAAEKDRAAAIDEGDEEAASAATAQPGGIKRTRLEQIVKWMQGMESVKGAEGDAKSSASRVGCVLFDECHKAKNLVTGNGSKGTLTAKAVVDLQTALPRARVVYCSATGASSVKNMAYMTRLGLWGAGTAFGEFGAFATAIERAGVGAMELVALDMKQRGMYMSRALSYKDASFETVEVQLNASQVKLYDSCAKFWQTMQECFEAALQQLDTMDGWRAPPTTMSQFWGAHQRFFKQLCMAIKVPEVVRIAKECRGRGECVVVGLQTTGEARMVEALKEAGEDGLEDFAGLYAIIENLLNSHFPTRGARDDEEDDGLMPDGLPRNPKSAASSAPPRCSASGAPASAPAVAANPAPVSDSDSDDDFSIEAASVKQEAIEAAPRRFGRYNAALLQLALGAFVSSQYKIPKCREDRLRKLSECYKGLWELGIAQLRRKLADLGIRGEAKPSSKLELVEALYARTVVCHYHLILAGGETLSALPLAELARALGLEASSPLMGSDDGDQAASDEERKDFDIGATARQRVLSGSLNGIKEELLREANSLALPDNPLDELIHQLGGTEKVAELTGRKMKLSYDAAGRASLVKRAKELDVTVARTNMAEKRAFMSGQKMVAIISEAASSGISLQADRREPNRAKRVHITLELPWSADEALQQLGRTHRSNQTSAPHYKLLMTSCGGERRFAAQLAKRLQHLGALTKGDRRAADAADLSQFDFQTKYGSRALLRLIDSIRSRTFGAGRARLLLDAVLGVDAAQRVEVTGDLSAWESHCEEVEEALMLVGIDLSFKAGDDKLPSVKTFLNRIIGLTVGVQRRVFAHFSALFDDEIARDKSEGRYDDGVVDMRADRIELANAPVPFYTDPTTRARTTLYTLKLDRGMDWQRAHAELQAANARESEMGNTGHINGFYEAARNFSSPPRKLQYLFLRKQYQAGEAQYNTKVYRTRLTATTLVPSNAPRRALSRRASPFMDCSMKCTESLCQIWGCAGLSNASLSKIDPSSGNIRWRTQPP